MQRQVRNRCSIRTLTLQLFQHRHFHLQNLLGLLGRLHLQSHVDMAQLVQDFVDLAKPTSAYLFHLRMHGRSNTEYRGTANFTGRGGRLSIYTSVNIYSIFMLLLLCWCSDRTYHSPSFPHHVCHWQDVRLVRSPTHTECSQGEPAPGVSDSGFPLQPNTKHTCITIEMTNVWACGHIYHMGDCTSDRPTVTKATMLTWAFTWVGVLG